MMFLCFDLYSALGNDPFSQLSTSVRMRKWFNYRNTPRNEQVTLRVRLLVMFLRKNDGRPVVFLQTKFLEKKMRSAFVRCGYEFGVQCP